MSLQAEKDEVFTSERFTTTATTLVHNTSHTSPELDGLVLNPLVSVDHGDSGDKGLNWNITRVTCAPCIILAVLSCILMFYLVLKGLSTLLRIFSSVLFFCLAQLCLIVVIAVSLYVMSKNMLNDHTCKVLSCVNAAAVIIPVYGVLLITTVRMIFIKWPLKQMDILQNVYLIPAMFGIVLLGGLIGSLPCIGLCDVKMINISEVNVSICEFTSDAENLTISPQCITFLSIYGSFGFAIPVALVIAFYLVIISTAARAKKQHKELQSSGINRCKAVKGTESSGEEAEGYLASFRKYWSFGRLAVALKRSQVRSDERRERMRIPWSIIVILVEYSFATLIWIPMELLPRQTYELLAKQTSKNFILYDIALTLMFLSLSISPLLYMLTSLTMREIFCKEIKTLAIKLHLIKKQEKPKASPLLEDARKRYRDKKKKKQIHTSRVLNELSRTSLPKSRPPK